MHHKTSQAFTLSFIPISYPHYVHKLLSSRRIHHLMDPTLPFLGGNAKALKEVVTSSTDAFPGISSSSSDGGAETGAPSSIRSSPIRAPSPLLKLDRADPAAVKSTTYSLGMVCNELLPLTDPTALIRELRRRSLASIPRCDNRKPRRPGVAVDPEGAWSEGLVSGVSLVVSLNSSELEVEEIKLGENVRRPAS
jgi:hypothetical protein